MFEQQVNKLRFKICPQIGIKCTQPMLFKQKAVENKSNHAKLKWLDRIDGIFKWGIDEGQV